MKPSAEAPPAVSLLGGTLARWLLVPCIVVVLALGLALLTEGMTKARDTNEHLAAALCRYLDIFVTDAHSNLNSLARIEGTGDPGHFLAAIRQTQESLSRFQRIFLVDAEGIVRFTHPPGFVGVDFPVLFPPASNATMSRPVYSSETGSLTIVIRAETASGSMLAGELNLDALLEHLQHFSQDLHGTLVAVTDRYGNLIIHPDMTLVRRQANIGDWRIFKEASDSDVFSALSLRDGILVSDTISQLPGHQWKVILSTSLWQALSDTFKIVATIEVLLVAYFLVLFLSVKRTLNRRIIRPIVNFSKSMTGRASSRQLDPPAPAPFLELGIIEREFDRAVSAIIESKEAAEAASQAKSEFLANMSHEIRTPLNGVMGILQLQAASATDREQLQLCDMALQAANRLHRLLSDILDLSRVEAGKLHIQAAPFRLRETLVQALDLFVPTSVQSGVELRHHVDPGVPDFVVGDPVRLQQVLGNLIGNAFKFTTSGHISVDVHPLPARKPELVRIFFSISDTGCGISDGDLEKLFAPFTQVSQGYTRSHQGAGLGLSICKQLVALMGGNMAIESEVGAGTTVSFCVTAGKALEAPAAGTSEIAGPLGAAGMRVLLAEDDEISCFSVQRLLEKAGCTVRVARDGREALEALEAEEFDVILMDIQMPSMSGLDATRLIRQDERLGARRHIPILAMTAYAMAGDRETFLAGGMNGYISKPVGFDALMQALQAVFSDAKRPPCSTGVRRPRPGS